MPLSTQESTPQIWLTHYHLGSPENMSRSAYLLCLAENAEDYTQKVNAYLAREQLNGQAQLAPLPIQTWLARHGFEAKLWRAAQQLSATTPLLCVYSPEDTEQNGQHLDAFLTQRSVRFAPFTEFIAPDVLPEEVRSLFFADFDGLGEYHKILNQAAHQREKQENQKEKLSQNRPHFYAVVDCAKAVSFPFRLQTAGRLENLYTGNIGQTLEEQAPYLLEFDPYQQETVAFLQRLFRKSESKVFSHWAINPVIFIKSQKPFDEVYRHLRKWTHLCDPDNEKWYFFRFYDPLVLNRYLPQLAHYPAQLAALFGVKPNAQDKQDKPVIEAFGLRVDDEFVAFTLNPLPDNTMPAKIELGAVERVAFEHVAWEKLSQKLIAMLVPYFPDVSESQAQHWLNEYKQKQTTTEDTSEREYWTYLSGRAIAEEKGLDYFELLSQYQAKKGYNRLNAVQALLDELI